MEHPAASRAAASSSVSRCARNGERFTRPSSNPTFCAPCPGKRKASLRASAGNGASAYATPTGSGWCAESAAETSFSVRTSSSRDVARNATLASKACRFARADPTCATESRCASTCAASCDADAANNAGVGADSSTSCGCCASAATVTAEERRARGASSTTCAFVPPKPKLDTAARRGTPGFVVHGTACAVS